MNSKAWLTLLGLSALLFGCSGKKEESGKEQKGGEASAEKASPESHVKHGTNGEAIVTVDAKLQPTIGLKTEPLAEAQLAPELKAYGRVLDPSGLASTVAELVTAEAAGQVSQAELARLKTLTAQNNASERALQTAQAAAIHDSAQIQSVRLRLLAGWGSAISQRNDLPDFVQSLGALNSAIVEVELPAGEAASANPTGARLFGLGDETNSISAEMLGPAPSVDPQMQGRGYLFLVSPNPQRLAPGAAVTALLSLPGEPRHGVLVPRSGVVWANGVTWAYQQISEEDFQRTQVTLDSPLPGGWFVANGLKPGDKIVTEGGQELFSEEVKGQIGGD
ncbi:MAG TPA: hypothetical protein VKY92_04820 [Verrucomicrobiae bacterium]|nr:hypothetical protein [Verrucomicrobiae bacterium]